MRLANNGAITSMGTSNKALSTREERYAQGRARGLSGTASAIAAGYSAHPGTASVTSARIAAREHVKARIAALMTSDTIDDDRSAYIAKLVELREAALGRGQVAAATRAQELIGKAQGVSGMPSTEIEGCLGLARSISHNKCYATIAGSAILTDPHPPPWRPFRQCVPLTTYQTLIPPNPNNPRLHPKPYDHNS